MAPKHWQIVRRDERGIKHEGRADTLAVDQAPPEVVQTALRATRGIGRGFYGVDLKQFGSKSLVMEVNDNPNVDRGVEDDVLHDELYQRIMAVFLKRIEARKSVMQGNPTHE
jgi:glutathione synthase/RimK-type ligase-like ATP-grasp enzyme